MLLFRFVGVLLLRFDCFCPTGCVVFPALAQCGACYTPCYTADERRIIPGG